ncbi:MAG: hypothetical protein AAGF11_38975 [Myxococcota bacterium]
MQRPAARGQLVHPPAHRRILLERRRMVGLTPRCNSPDQGKGKKKRGRRRSRAAN